MRARLAALVLPLISSLVCSQVVINEIAFTPAGTDLQWIELVNLGNPVDIGGWSVYQATKTPGRAQNYWFGLPTGTVISPNRYLRIHWLAPLKGDDAGNIYTGTDNLNFLFGLGAEPLAKSGGALALFNTQDNARMNDAAIVQDWVQWGAGGWKRENLAVTNQRWVAGTFVPAVPDVESIAFFTDTQAEPTAVASFFRDRSPTPATAPNFDNGHNYPQAAFFDPIGSSCTTGNIPLPQIELVSISTLGNLDFGFRISPVTPISASFLVLAGEKGNGTVFIGDCEFWLGLSTIPLVIIGTNSGNQSFVSLVPEDASLVGVDLFAQWLTADLPTLAIGSTGARQFHIGR